MGGDIEEFEGGGDRRLQHTRCRVELQRLPPLLHEGGDCRLPLLHALLHGRPAGLHTLLHGGPRQGLSAVPPSSKGGEKKFCSLANRSPPSSKGGERDTCSPTTLLHVDASVYSPTNRSPPSSKEVDRGTYSTATLLHADASVCSPADDDSELFTMTATRPSRVYELPDLPYRTERPPADDEFELTAPTAANCSYVSAYDSNNAVGAVIRERDVTMILNSSVLNAACGTPASIGHGAKGTLSPGSIQSVVSRRHGNRTTSTSVSSPGSYSSR